MVKIMKIEFIDFKATPSEDKQHGVATVSYDDKIWLRYKVQKGKDGKGYYLKPATHKIGDEYIPAFVIDSNFVNTAIDQCLRDNLKAYLDSEVGHIPF
jgi:hypothetical protein